MSDVIPMLAYEDTAKAIEWLEHAFGFRERTEHRFTEPDSRITHAEMEAGDGLIMLATPTLEYQLPLRHEKSCPAARAWSRVPWVINGVLVYVDDAQAHFERAKAAGATMLSEVETGFPGPRYRAADLEGQRWMFLQRPGTSTA